MDVIRLCSARLTYIGNMQHAGRGITNPSTRFAASSSGDRARVAGLDLQEQQALELVASILPFEVELFLVMCKGYLGRIRLNLDRLDTPGTEESHAGCCALGNLFRSCAEAIESLRLLDRHRHGSSLWGNRCENEVMRLWFRRPGSFYPTSCSNTDVGGRFSIHSATPVRRRKALACHINEA